MPDKTEKARRRELLHSVLEDGKRKLRDSLPVPAPVLKALFDYLDARLESSECDDTLRHVREFTHGHSLPEEAVVRWLEGNGGHCDCEALANVEQVVEDAVPGYEKLKPSTNPSE
jgi:Protein of unknown function (DUF2695)